LKLIKKLQECSTIGQADPILTRLGAGPAVKKLVETAIILANSQDPQQRSHAYSFMESAIKELEDDDMNKKIHEEEDDDKKLHEEELSNHNQGERTTGSEQSSENTEPYTGEGKDTTNGEKPMNGLQGTENQWNETGGILPGLAPDVAQEIGAGLADSKPMNNDQSLRQIQYTVNAVVSDLYRKEIVPLQKTVHNQREALRELSNQQRETQAYNGSMKLDIEKVRNNASAIIRETSPVQNDNFNPLVDVRPHKKHNLTDARNQIAELDKILTSKNKSMYQ
jgi:hypothetical protein